LKVSVHKLKKGDKERRKIEERELIDNKIEVWKGLCMVWEEGTKRNGKERIKGI